MVKLGNKGQALVEYLLIIAVISVIVVTLVKALGGVLQDKMTESTCTIMNQEYIPGEKIGQGKCAG